MNMNEKFEILAEKVRNHTSCSDCPLNINNPYCDYICCIDCTAEDIKDFYEASQKFIEMIKSLKEEPLDEVEKKYLTNILRPFVKNYDITITKETDNYLEKEYLIIKLYVKGACTDAIELPYFKPNTMYKGMTSHRVYTLKALGLKF